MEKDKKILKMNKPSRRKFIKAAAATGAVAVAASSLAAPAVAADRVEIAMVTTWPRDFPGLGTGAQRFAQRLTDMSDGRFQVQYFASGERFFICEYISVDTRVIINRPLNLSISLEIFTTWSVVLP